MKQLLQISFFTLLFFFFLQCASSESKPQTNARLEAVKATTEAYFQTFAERKDWDKLLSFYDPDFVFEDIIIQKHTQGLEGFKQYYDWPNPDFQKLFPEQKHLEIEHIVVNDSTAVVHGHVNPFYWKGQLFEMEWGAKFTIWLFFNEDMKIAKQIDWFEYSGDVLVSVGERLMKEFPVSN